MRLTTIEKTFMGILILLSVCLAGCGDSGVENTIPSIEASEFESIVGSRDNAQILDVRREEEYADGHVPGAIHVSLLEIQSNRGAALGKITFSKDKHIFILCTLGGHRSQLASQILMSNGYKTKFVEGGTLGYRDLGNELER